MPPNQQTDCIGYYLETRQNALAIFSFLPRSPSISQETIALKARHLQPALSVSREEDGAFCAAKIGLQCMDEIRF